ncbi:MAG: hypothetical protein MK233_01070, partial [Candidatus Poseidoniales archaeon]|nr:hypothetical protein [Candidatus Poseidoniales archaeon]
MLVDHDPLPASKVKSACVAQSHSPITLTFVGCPSPASGCHVKVVSDSLTRSAGGCSTVTVPVIWECSVHRYSYAPGVVNVKVNVL